MKTEEAKEKVCPFIQSTTATNDSSCSDYNTHKNINCICGDCMAWKSIENKEIILEKCDMQSERFIELHKQYMLYDGTLNILKSGDGVYEVEHIKIDHTTLGYCARIGQ